MEREEDDYEDIVNEEKKAEATAGQSTCLLSFLILVTYDKDGNPVKTFPRNRMSSPLFSVNRPTLPARKTSTQQRSQLRQMR